jgi:hypothetical protein
VNSIYDVKKQKNGGKKQKKQKKQKKTNLCSSVVERITLNNVVVGSIPTKGIFYY